MNPEKKTLLLKQILREMNLRVKRRQQEALLHYDALLCDECARQRLVGDPAEIIAKHIPDALYPLAVLQIGSGPLLDLGTGGGLPGIPLKILLPETPVYLMDSRERRFCFLQRAVQALALKETFVLCGRAERFGQDHRYREKFEWIVARAVGKTAVLAELALPFLAIGGKMLIYKGPRGRAELKQAEAILAHCGGKIEQYWCYRLPSGEKRTLFLIQKVRLTPSCYPRRSGVPSKRPLRSSGNTCT